MPSSMFVFSTLLHDPWKDNSCADSFESNSMSCRFVHAHERRGVCAAYATGVRTIHNSIASRGPLSIADGPTNLDCTFCTTRFRHHTLSSLRFRPHAPRSRTSRSPDEVDRMIVRVCGLSPSFGQAHLLLGVRWVLLPFLLGFETDVVSDRTGNARGSKRELVRL